MKNTARIDKIWSANHWEATIDDGFLLRGNFSWGDGGSSKGAAWTIHVEDDGTVRKMGGNVIENNNFIEVLKNEIEEYRESEKENSESVMNVL